MASRIAYGAETCRHRTGDRSRRLAVSRLWRALCRSAQIRIFPVHSAVSDRAADLRSPASPLLRSWLENGDPLRRDALLARPDAPRSQRVSLTCGTIISGTTATAAKPGNAAPPGSN